MRNRYTLIFSTHIQWMPTLGGIYWWIIVVEIMLAMWWEEKVDQKIL